MGFSGAWTGNCQYRTLNTVYGFELCFIETGNNFFEIAQVFLPGVPYVFQAAWGLVFLGKRADYFFLLLLAKKSFSSSVRLI